MTLITDQGREFCNDLNDTFCKKMGINHRLASPYHPQTGGLTERFNRTLCTMLSSLVNKEHDNWDDKLTSVLFAYRTTKHTSTKKTPFYLVYGREATLPVELDLPTQKESTDDVSEDEALAARCNAFIDVSIQREEASANIKQSQRRQKKYHDAKIPDSSFNINDKVLLHNTRQTTRKGGKLEPKWSGPYNISAVLPKGAYRLEGRKCIVNGNRHKLYKSEEDGEDDESGQNKDNKIPHNKCLPPKKRTITIEEPIDNGEMMRQRSAINFNPVDQEWMVQNSFKFKETVKNQVVYGNSRAVRSDAKPSKVVKIRGDGNCLFRALTHVTLGVQTSHRAIRNQIVEYMCSHEDIMKKIESRPMADYVKQTKMDRLGTWGTETGILAFATMTNTVVYV